MPLITQILEQKRRANRRSVYLDGKFAFGCNQNVIVRFKLKEGQTITAGQVSAILQGAVRQECFDAAMNLLQQRLHARDEMFRKLIKKEYSAEMTNNVLDQLAEMGYVNDEQFAQARASLAAQHRQHGRRRAMVELLKRGVNRETARVAVEKVYETTDSLAIARQLAQKKAASLRRLEPMVARRRLAGMLARRGFEYDVVKPVIDEVIGYGQGEPPD
ncbi:MAG TPA: RecX family transcriptional regulator [Tepidisphaeraceae bacterium]|mgnify:CR=1 FL=1|nr:RecX family transcriptional regulator [Tepidisphaeraceae bacterium]